MGKEILAPQYHVYFPVKCLLLRFLNKHPREAQSKMVARRDPEKTLGLTIQTTLIFSRHNYKTTEPLI